MQKNLKWWLPHLIALGLFILIPLIYFLPVLQGKALGQSDISNFLGVTKEIFDFRAHFHSEPLWTNSMFGGMPAYQVSTIYHANLLQYVFMILTRWLPFPANVVFLYCIGFYVLMLVLDVDARVAIVGSFAFAFSSFFFIILAAGHNSEAEAIAFMSPVLAGVILAFKGKRLAGVGLTGIALALELYAGHIQITYYLFMMLGIYAISQLVDAFRKKQLPAYFKTAALLVVAGALAVCTNITSLWLTYQYGKYSTRGKSELTLGHENKSSGLTRDYATQWCYGVGETMTMLIPDFKGGESKPLGEYSKSLLKDVNSQYPQMVAQLDSYWGDQPFTAGPVYAGAIVCFLALMGFFVVKGPFKWFLFIATLLSFVLSWGKNPVIIFGTSIFDFFFDHVPGFNNFRAVSMILVIAELTLPVFAALALNKLVKDKDFMKEMIPVKFFKNMNGRKIFFISIGVTGGIALLCYVMPGMFSDFQKTDEYNQTFQEFKQGNSKVSDQQIQSVLEDIIPAAERARKKIFTADAGRTLIFIVLAGALIWVYSRKMIDTKFFIGGLLFFVLADMYNVDKRYLNDKNFENKREAKVPYQPNQADLDIMRDTMPDYRVFNSTIAPDQDSRTSYFHKSLGGYSGVKMKRYDELLSYQIRRGNMNVIDMLNAKYFIIRGKDGEDVAQQNPGALGNAWFVSNYKIVPDADSEMTALSTFDPKKTAIVDKRFSKYLNNVNLSYDSTGYVELKSYEPNDLVYASHARSEQLAVFSEIYYKDGWDAFIDGQPADYIRVNYVLRAMLVPVGNHTIEFKFEPKAYSIGEKISLASSLILILGCLALLFSELRKQPE